MNNRESPPKNGAVRWAPIEPLDSADYSSRELQELIRLTHIKNAWDQFKSGVDEAAINEFMAELNRSIAVETGILEGLYELDRGITETLVEYGFTQDAVERARGKVDSNVLSMLRDQFQSSAMIMDAIAGTRDITVGFIRQLHALITRSQETYTARDQFGIDREQTLEHGEFKRQPNNPSRDGEIVHEYAPPEQVGSEMDRLIEMYDGFNESVHPVLQAVWLHHRFVSIHPFADGNGRVARALTSFALIKGGYLPLHVRREDRQAYIGALEESDKGSLRPLVELFARRQRQELLNAMSIATRIEARRTDGVEFQGGDGASRVRAVSRAVAHRWWNQEAARIEERREVGTVGRDLTRWANDRLNEFLNDAKSEFSSLGFSVVTFSEFGGIQDSRGHWWNRQIVRSAKAAGHYANLSEDRFWVRGALEYDKFRMVFVISIHHIGRPISGVMAATTWAEIFHRNGDARDRFDGDDAGGPEWIDCMDQSFTFTGEDDRDRLHEDLDRWIDECLAVAIRVFAMSIR